MLCLLFWPGACEAVRWAADDGWQAFAATAASPVHAIVRAAQPSGGGGAWLADTVNIYLLVAGGAAVLLNALAIFGVRRWNPTREAARGPQEEHPDAVSNRALGRTRLSPRQDAHATRPVWDYPIIWREMRTWAYGRKVVFVRMAYLLLAAAVARGVVSNGP